MTGWLRPLAEGATVLEVGGGVGAIQLELLDAGAAHATNVELSPAYEDAARALAAEAGATDRVERIVGDYARGEDPGPADLLVLHRVVCCYPDMPALVTRAATAGRVALAITYPRDTWWVRAGFRLTNLFLRLWRNPFRVYVHDPAAISATVTTTSSLVPFRHERGMLWESRLYQRR